MKKIFLFTVIAAAVIIGSSFTKAKPAADGINWMTWQQVQEAQKKQPRKVVVDVFTEWCGWCKRMDASTFTHPEVIKYVNEHFYAIKFDAETEQTITLNGKEYKFVPQGNRGYNELAAKILNGQMSYPTSVYFDETLEEIFPAPGYQDPKMFETVLNYVASNSYKTMQFDKYQPTFKGKVAQ